MPSRRRWTSRRRRRQVRRIAAATSTIGATMVGSGRRPRCVLFRLHKLLALGLPAADFVVGSAPQDEQARQWDGRYDGLSIGTTIGGEDQ